MFFVGVIMKKYFNTFNLHCKFLGFSLVELMISLIVISLITAALAPVITKKLTSGTITVGSFGGGGGGGENITCPAGLYIDMDTKTCEVCPAGFECDGANKIPCPAGTFSLNRQSECTPCEDGYYSLDGATQCLENTAQNCAEKSKVDNACLSCDGEDILVDGNCILSVPIYTFLNSGGSNITETATELTKDENYWYIKIKSTGTLTFSSMPTNLIDVFVVGGGRGGRKATSGCASTDPGGGGNYNILNNVFVSNDTNYPITIGAGTSAGTCAREASNGGTSSAFDGSAAGGTGTTTSHTICLFAGTSSYDCMLTYGNYGTNDNQFQNSGNGGTKANGGMNGVVIIRGTL